MKRKNQIQQLFLVTAILLLALNFTSTENTFAKKDSETTKKIESIHQKDIFQKNKDFLYSLKYSKKSVIIEGNSENIYKEFENRYVALEELNKKNSDFIKYLMKRFDIGKLSNKNWKSYYEIINSEDIDSKYEREIFLFKSFFDIYENTDKNDEILNLINESNLKSSPIDKEKKEKLFLLLPSYSKFANKIKDVRGTEINSLLEGSLFKLKGTKNFGDNILDVNKAVEYAMRYAYSPNKNYYSFYTGDCANFVSQIMKASGKQLTDDWWCRFSKDAFGNYVVVEYSRAWSFANDFVHHFGVYYSTKSHKSFSTGLGYGTIIAFDSSDDGDWDHIAFVTAADNELGTYNGYTYFDYEVAQHTKNYLEWTSTPINKWEEIENYGGRYAVIRY